MLNAECWRNDLFLDVGRRRGHVAHHNAGTFSAPPRLQIDYWERAIGRGHGAVTRKFDLLCYDVVFLPSTFLQCLRLVSLSLTL